MHINRLDIDRKNSAEHLQVGPLGNGLNAIYAPIPGGSDTLARFVRTLLFRGNDALATYDEEFHDSLDGSMQWVDASGHVRMMSTSSGASQSPNRFLHSPLHPSERPIHADDSLRLSGLGNILTEGDDHDQRWDELRGDILGMVFCSPLGTVSPEKLWWAASRLGVHAHAKSQLDEGYQRLKAEEQDLLERLRHVENVDHDRAWWSIERDRLAAEIQHVHSMNATASTLASSTPSPRPQDAAHPPLRERLASIQIEISKLRAQIQDIVIQEANLKLDSHRRDDHRMNFANVSMHPSSNLSSPLQGRAGTNRSEFELERTRLQTRVEHLLAEQASVELLIRNAVSSASTTAPVYRHWDDSQLREQHAHAEEMIRRWDRRVQAHRRLSEIQSHLKTRSPYRRTTDGSLIPKVEKYLRNMTSGAVRQLPVWAVEASYLQNSDNYSDAYHAVNHGAAAASGRSEFYDRTVPTENTRHRKLVDLAIRLAIADAAVPRIGRIPMLLDDSINAFQGDALEQVLHVLATFSRDGRQLLISTNDEYTARRIASHGGTVSRMQEIMRFARPNLVLDGAYEVGLHPSLRHPTAMLPFTDGRSWRVVGADSPNGEIIEINRQLTGLANEQSTYSWWHPELQARTSHPTKFVETTTNSNARRTFLQPESLVSEAPGVDREFARRLNSQGIYRVGDLLRSNASSLGATIRVDADMLEQVQNVADLMCGTPMLRAFDAQVLVGCGINRPGLLRDIGAGDLVARVESFLDSYAGQDLVRRASSFEVSRIHGWLADMKRAINQRRNPRDSERFERQPSVQRSSDRSNEASKRTRFDNSHAEPQMRPRVVRSSQYDDASEQSATRPARTTTATQSATASQWKFFLDIESPVVDAPSIGPRMAEKLAPLNVLSIGDLMASDTASLAAQLADKSVSADTVAQWQYQALLVCRIPNLRGHDAQLLVGSGYTTAEQVAAADPASLFDKVTRFASSKSGVRILRGSTAPDLAEVTDWVQWSQNCRAIRAA